MVVRSENYYMKIFEEADLVYKDGGRHVNDKEASED